ncbi:MAG: nucleotidyl transferase AbiEii/AbiGii toxin family protein, partial [Anaerolineae bacterium]|nr:nucleotidyl transferase AbiEii/AbiGii toxin family protein [Anaerolineae bacterium]
ARLRERGWGASRVCRDYYDLWYILSHGTLSRTALPDLVARKCLVRHVAFESVSDFLAPELLSVAQAEWDHLLQPFIPSGPPVAQVLNELAEMLTELTWTG